MFNETNIIDTELHSRQHISLFAVASMRHISGLNFQILQYLLKNAGGL